MVWCRNLQGEVQFTRQSLWSCQRSCAVVSLWITTNIVQPSKQHSGLKVICFSHNAAATLPPNLSAGPSEPVGRRAIPHSLNFGKNRGRLVPLKDFLLLPAPLDFQTFLRPWGTLCSRMCSWLSKPTFCGLVFVVLRNWPISSPIIIICYQHQLLQGRPNSRCYSELFKFFPILHGKLNYAYSLIIFHICKYLPWKERNQ